MGFGVACLCVRGTGCNIEADPARCNCHRQSQHRPKSRPIRRLVWQRNLWQARPRSAVHSSAALAHHCYRHRWRHRPKLRSSHFRAEPQKPCMRLRSFAATGIIVAPSYDRSVGKNGGKSIPGIPSGLNLLHVLKLLFNIVGCPLRWQHCPRSRQIHQPVWQRKHDLRLEFAAHFATAPGRHCCHHRLRHCPKSRQIHRQGWQQKLPRVSVGSA